MFQILTEIQEYLPSEISRCSKTQICHPSYRHFYLRWSAEANLAFQPLNHALTVKLNIVTGPF